MSAAGPFLKTPVEVLARILSYLPCHIVAKHVSPVCRLLYAVSQSESLWAHLLITPCDVHELFFFAEKHPEIRYLDASSVQDFTAGDLRRLARDLPALEYLLLSEVHPDVWAEVGVVPEWILTDTEAKATTEASAGSGVTNEGSDDNNDATSGNSDCAGDANPSSSGTVAQRDSDGKPSSGRFRLPVYRGQDVEVLVLSGPALRVLHLPLQGPERVLEEKAALCRAVIQRCTHVVTLVVNNMSDVGGVDSMPSFPHLRRLQAYSAERERLVAFLRVNPHIATLRTLASADTWPSDRAAAFPQLDSLKILDTPQTEMIDELCGPLASNTVLRALHGRVSLNFIKLIADHSDTIARVTVVGGVVNKADKEAALDYIRASGEDGHPTRVDYFSCPSYGSLTVELATWFVGLTSLYGALSGDAAVLAALGERLSRLRNVAIGAGFTSEAAAFYSKYKPQVHTLAVAGLQTEALAELAVCVGNLRYLKLIYVEPTHASELVAAAAASGTCVRFYTDDCDNAATFVESLPDGTQLRRLELTYRFMALSARGFVEEVTKFLVERGGSIANFASHEVVRALIPEEVYPWVHGRAFLTGRA